MLKWKREELERPLVKQMCCSFAKRRELVCIPIEIVKKIHSHPSIETPKGSNSMEANILQKKKKKDDSSFFKEKKREIKRKIITIPFCFGFGEEEEEDFLLGLGGGM
jgi:hypothetical protein